MRLWVHRLLFDRRRTKCAYVLGAIWQHDLGAELSETLAEMGGKEPNETA